MTAKTTVYRLLTLAHGMECVAASTLDLVSGPDWVKTAPFNILRDVLTHCQDV